MGSAYDETVFDFDLNFLNPTTTTTTTANTVQELQAKNEKLRRSVIFLKKKILFSNSAVTRYKNARSYANVLENNQVFNKEGCKQHLIEIRNFIEKVTKLENENQAAENREREKDETISELQNKICALQSLETQLKLLLKEKNKTESTVKVEKKVIVRDSGKNSLLEKENEILRKENAKIPKLEKEIENLRKGQTGVATSENNCDSLLKDRTTIINLEKEIETLRQENSNISRLQKQIEILSKENAKLSKLEKELQTLRKEDTKMTRLEKENESLRKDNARVLALEKEIETLRIKNAKIGFLERVNKTLREENARIQNNNKEGLLTNLTSIEEKEKSKKSNSGRTRSVSNRNSDWSDHSGAENDIFEDAPMSPQPSDKIVAKNPLPADKNIVRRESENDNSNEVVSVDTGRGSSLAYSDNEKGFHSPGYFSNDSPLNGESIDNKANNNNTPQRIVQIIVQDENNDMSNSDKTTTRPGETNTELLNQISMVEGTRNKTCVIQEESINLQNSNNMTPKKHTQGVLEKESLDLHNSMQQEARIDAEVENIFSTMKLNYHAVSPIPRTPIRVRGNDSTKKSSEPSEQIMRCMYLSNKTDHLLTKLKGYLHKCTAEYFCKFNPNLSHQNSKFLNRKVKGGRDFSAVHNIDKLIQCFEAILKTKQILTEDCNKSYLDVSDRVCENLLIRNVTGLGTDSFHNKQGEARSIRQTISPPICSPLPVLRDVQRKELVQNDNTLVSAHATLPEINKDVLQDKQKKARLASINPPMSPESNQNHNDAMQEDQSDTQLLPPVIIVSSEPVQNQDRSTLFSNDVSMSSDPKKGCQDASQDNQKETRLSFDIIPVSPAALEKPNNVKQGNQRRTRLFSNDSPTSPNTVQNNQDALQDNQREVRLSSDNIPGSPEPVQKQNNVRQGNQRRTRLFSNDSPMSPDTMQNNQDALQDNQREVRLSSDNIPGSPESVHKQNNVSQGNQRRTRLFSSDSPTSPDTMQKSQDALQDNQKAVRLSSDTTPVSPESVHKQNKEKKSNQRRARLFSNGSPMSPDTMQKNQDALQDKQKEVRLSTDTTPVSPASVENQNNEMQRNIRRTRLFSDDTPMSPDTHDNQKEVKLPSDNIPVSPESVHKQNKEKQSNKRRTRLFSNDSSMSPDTMQNSQDPLHNNPKKDTTPVSPRPVQDQNNTLQSNRRRTRLFSNDLSMSPDTKQNNQDTSQDNPKKDNTPVSPRPVQDQNNTLRGKQRRTRLFSNDSSISPDTKQNNQDTSQDKQKKDITPVSPRPVQDQNNTLQSNKRRTRLFSNDLSMSPDTKQNNQDTLQDKQKKDTTPVSPRPVQEQNNTLQSNKRRTRLFSNDLSMSPDTMQNSQDTLQDKQKKDITPVSPRPVQDQNNTLQGNRRRTRLFSNDSSMSPDTMQNSQDTLQDNPKKDTTPVSPRLVEDQNNTLRGKQRRTRLFSNDSSPEPKLNCQNGLQDSQKKVRLSSDTLHISPEPKQKHEVLQDKQGLLSITIPMSPDSIQNKRKTRLSSATSPVSTASTQNPSNIVPVNQRKTRLSSITSPTSPRPTNSEDLLNNQRRTRLSSNSAPLSPPIESRKDDLQNNQRKARLSSVTSPKSPAPIQTLNHAVSEESITDDEPIINLGNAYRSQDSVEMNELSMKDSTVKKAKTKKITKLDKLRKNLAPKYKIRRETSPVKSLIKPKHLTPIKKQVSANVTSASLNDKDVYEKAVKIMAELNSQKLSKAMKSPTRCTKEPMSPKPKNNMDIQIDSCNENKTSQNSLVTTRNKRKLSEVTDQCSVVLTKDPLLLIMACEAKTSPTKTKDDNETSDDTTSRKRRRLSSNDSVVKCKRILRSSAVQLRSSTEDNVEISNTNDERTKGTSTDPTTEKIKTTSTTCEPKPLVADTQKDENMKKSDDHHQLNTYDDLDLFAEDIQVETPSVSVKEIDSNPSTACQPKDSILCCMLEKYGTASVKPFAKKIPDSKVKLICEKIEQEVATISELPLNDTKNAMNTFVADLRKLNYKVFISGLIKYLTKPERKLELFAKQSSPAAPAMTKAEQILLYVITHLKTHWPTVDIVDAVLSSIEYALFKLNRTPEFEVIESTSHFYALLCRYFGAKSRLRLFILDAMYCIQFKSVPLIKQCLEVWMHIIPLAHMGIAKNPLVTCLVYLLHFYKCDDKFNRVQEIRNILSRRYFYQITDWNETKILEMFKNSIKDLKDIPIENKMLRLALIILAKRHGPRWCQNNIIKNLLQPMIEKENVPNSVKVFCVSMIGPLMKPYPVDMKVHCEIAINQLIDILNNNPSPQMEEAAIMSMMFINRHDQYSTNQILLTRKMKPMSAELEKTLRDYVKRKPLQVWKKTLSKIAR
ncbi:uncharacterized protein LOC110371892 [Helicoverpa armigera]|uniref:uncharacterized protein LOC110371892 n=1 Tax=Helicoverpa armigera TaxID=29058 RepID=UPI003083CD0B